MFLAALGLFAVDVDAAHGGGGKKCEKWQILIKLGGGYKCVWCGGYNKIGRAHV